MAYSKRKNYRNNNYRSNMSAAERREVERLVDDLKDKGFRNSSQLSNHIHKNKLGRRYSHISGAVTMQNDNDSWDFKGGISPKAYAEVCSRLELDNKGSRAQAIEFESYDSMYQRKRR